MKKKKPLRTRTPRNTSAKHVTKKAQPSPLKVETKQLALLPLFIRSTLLSFLIAFTLLAVSALIVIGVLYQKSLLFTDSAQTSLVELLQTGYAGWHKTPEQDSGKVNFLILGSDELSNRESDRPLTDTIIVASLNLNSAQVSLFSLPRDIWINKYQTKINALYADNCEQNPNDQAKIPKEVVSELTGVPIHHTIIMKLNTLSELVDLVGGVDVNVKESFTDPLFPRSDVDVTKVRDPKLLYETVSFASGSTHMSGDMVLKYVRSRHATGIEGSDNARGTRQQEVIFALIEKFKDQSFWGDLRRAGLLYHFYRTHFAQYLPMTEAIAIGNQLQPHFHEITFSQGTPKIFPDVNDGVIYHPTGSSAKYFGAWVYEIRDPALFKAQSQADLHYTP